MTKSRLIFDDSRKLDVITLGRVAIDFNPDPQQYYRPLSQVTTYHRYVGGSPANIAVGLARLGKAVGFVGKAANDEFGRYVTEYLQSQGVDVTGLTKCAGNEKTGLAFTEILSETESSILMYRDRVADMALDVEDIDEAYIASAKMLVISGTSLAAQPSRNAALKALSLAHKNGVTVVFDIDYRPTSWPDLREVPIYYSLVAQRSNIILGSRDEFNITERLLLQGNEDDGASARYWFSQNAEMIVIKHGKEGSNAFLASGEMYRVKPFPVKLLKSFGGGDGYAAALLCGLLEGWALEDALSRASASAAMLVASKCCSDDMPTMDALLAFEAEQKQAHGAMVKREDIG